MSLIEDAPIWMAAGGICSILLFALVNSVAGIVSALAGVLGFLVALLLLGRGEGE